MMSDKKLEKIEKLLGEDKIGFLNNASNEDLKASITNAAQSIKATQEELEANPVYQDLKENLKAASEGLREVKKRQNAIIQYSLHVLEGKSE